MCNYRLLILGLVVMLTACSQTASAPSDVEDDFVESSSSKELSCSSSKIDDEKSSVKETSKSSSSKSNNKSSSSKSVDKGSSSKAVDQSSSSKSINKSSSSVKNDKSSSSKESEKSSSSVNESSSSSQKQDECVGEVGNPWDGTTAKKFACGAGTKLSPYIILTAEQLAKLSFAIGSSDADYQGKYFKLGADIILNKGKIIDDKGALVADSTKLHKWTPIGNSSVSFLGSFDGDGHTVSGMFINTTSTHNGLFGNVSGTVQNVTVADSWVYGGNYTAGVVGLLKSTGTIKGAINKSTVIGNGNITGGIFAGTEYVCCNNSIGNVENVQNFGFISGAKNAGGIAGSAQYTKIKNALNDAEIVGVQEVGGIIGSLGTNTSLTLALNYGKITGKSFTGGIAGYSGDWVSCPSAKRAIIENTVNFGEVSGTTYTAGVVGKNECTKNSLLVNKARIVGTNYVAGLLGYSKNSKTTSAYNMGDVFGDIYVGGAVGYNEVGVSQSVYSTGKVDGDSLVGLMIGYNYNTTMADYYYLEQGEQEPFGLNNGGGVATPKTADEMKSDDFAELLGDDFVYDSGLNDGYPVLKWERK